MIPSQSTKIIYLGDGTTTSFPFNFKYSDGDDVKVAIYEVATDTTTVLERDYFVDTNANIVKYPGYPPGQEPALSDQPEPLPEGFKLVIYRETPITQEVDLGTKYPLSTLEKMDDKAILICQELAEKLSRCIMARIGSTTTAEELIEQIHNDRIATQQDMLTTKGYKEDVAADLAVSISARDTAISYAGDAEGYKDQAHQYMTVAQNNANAAQNAANMAQGYAQSSSDSANQAANASEGSEHWAHLAFEYVEPLRHALGNMFEYDANGDIQLVEDPLTGTDPSWEVDENGDIMPAEMEE